MLTQALAVLIQSLALCGFQGGRVGGCVGRARDELEPIGEAIVIPIGLRTVMWLGWEKLTWDGGGMDFNSGFSVFSSSDRDIGGTKVGGETGTFSRSFWAAAARLLGVGGRLWLILSTVVVESRCQSDTCNEEKVEVKSGKG